MKTSGVASVNSQKGPVVYEPEDLIAPGTPIQFDIVLPVSEFLDQNRAGARSYQPTSDVNVLILYCILQTNTKHLLDSILLMVLFTFIQSALQMREHLFITHLLVYLLFIFSCTADMNCITFFCWNMSDALTRLVKQKRTTADQMTRTVRQAHFNMIFNINKKKL